MLNKIRKVLDETLVHVSQKKNNKLVNDAFKWYKSPFGAVKTDMDLEYGFNNWLLHDYLVNQKTPLVEYYLNDFDKKAVEAVSKSVYSVFKVQIETNNVVFKDVITSQDYLIDSDQVFNNNDLLKVRLYPVDNKFVILDNVEYYDQSLETIIRKSVMNKYNEYCSANEPMGIQVFVKRHSQLIYHLTNIIDFYEAELEEEAGLDVYVATYAIKDKDELLDLLLDTDAFQLIEHNEYETIVDFVSEDVQLAEIVVTSQKVEIEVNSETGLLFAKETFESAVASKAVFVKDEIISLSDLL